MPYKRPPPPLLTKLTNISAAGIIEYQTELPDFLANQLSEYYYNAWQAQTVGQSSYHDALNHFYPSNATLVDGQSLVPNRPVSFFYFLNSSLTG